MPSQSFNDPLSINPGDLRHQIKIQVQSKTQNPETGEPSSTWNEVLSTYAAISTPTSREMYQTGQAAQFVAQVTHMVKIRWPGVSVTIAGGMRVLFGTRIFAIQTVENVLERNRIVKLLCLETNEGAGCS